MFWSIVLFIVGGFRFMSVLKQKGGAINLPNEKYRENYDCIYPNKTTHKKQVKEGSKKEGNRTGSTG